VDVFDHDGGVDCKIIDLWWGHKPGGTSAFFALFLDFGSFGQRQDATIKPHLSRLRCDGRHAGLGVWLEGADILRIETTGCSIGDPTLGWFDVRFWETDPQTSQLRHGWLGTPCR
jgi:hypothetical protein